MKNFKNKNSSGKATRNASEAHILPSYGSRWGPGLGEAHRGRAPRFRLCLLIVCSRPFLWRIACFAHWKCLSSGLRFPQLFLITLRRHSWRWGAGRVPVSLSAPLGCDHIRGAIVQTHLTFQLRFTLNSIRCHKPRVTRGQESKTTLNRTATSNFSTLCS